MNAEHEAKGFVCIEPACSAFALYIESTHFGFPVPIAVFTPMENGTEHGHGNEKNM